jgi:gas vesicle protein
MTAMKRNRRNEMSRNNWQGTASGVLIGLGVGVGLGILLAPKSGKQTRDQIVGTVKDGIDSAVAQGRDLTRRAQKAIDAASESVSDAADAGEQAYRQAKSIVS